MRLRSNRRFGGPLESIDARKRRRLIATARHYLAHHAPHAPARIDVVGLDGEQGLDWIPNAIECSP